MEIEDSYTKFRKLIEYYDFGAQLQGTGSRSDVWPAPAIPLRHVVYV